MDANGPDLARVRNLAIVAGIDEAAVDPEGQPDPLEVEVIRTHQSAAQYGPISWTVDKLYTVNRAQLTLIADRVLGLRALPVPRVDTLDPVTFGGPPRRRRSWPTCASVTGSPSPTGTPLTPPHPTYHEPRIDGYLTPKVGANAYTLDPGPMPTEWTIVSRIHVVDTGASSGGNTAQHGTAAGQIAWAQQFFAGQFYNRASPDGTALGRAVRQRGADRRGRHRAGYRRDDRWVV